MIMKIERNPVGWFEIYVADMERARNFYAKTLGVELEKMAMPESEDMDGMEMWSFPMEMEVPGAAGALVKMEGCGPGGGGTLVYFSCADCAVEEGRAAEAGGQVVKGKFPIGEYGFIAMVMDTEGNMIGLHSNA